MKRIDKILLILVTTHLSLTLYIKYKQKQISVVQITSINDAVHNINRGGCGFFALQLYRKINGEDYDIVQFPQHFALRHKQKQLYLDATGITDKTSFELTHGGQGFVITQDSLEKLITKPNYWNREFNQDDTCKIIEFFENL